MDEFKKYLQANKSELNSDEPQPFIWKKIEAAIKPAQAPIRIIPILKWAAAACIIALAGLGGWHLFSTDKTAIPIRQNILVKQAAKQPVPSIKQIIIAEPETIHPKNITAANYRTTLLPKKSFEKQKVLDPLFNNIETGFIQVINLQKARISTTPMYAESPEYFNDFKQQIKQMEQEEKTIKTNIIKHGLGNNLLDELINLYQQKLTILKQLQLEMNKTNNRFKQNRGPVDSTRNYFLSI